jgi:hypothetical protein
MLPIRLEAGFRQKQFVLHQELLALQVLEHEGVRKGSAPFVMEPLLQPPVVVPQTPDSILIHQLLRNGGAPRAQQATWGEASPDPERTVRSDIAIMVDRQRGPGRIHEVCIRTTRRQRLIDEFSASTQLDTLILHQAMLAVE